MKAMPSMLEKRVKQLVILSGKGGTGKTSLTAAFAHLSSIIGNANLPVIVDADVDAANLNLVLKSQIGTPQQFWGGSLAEIDSELCCGCGQCVSACRYDAILAEEQDEPVYRVDPIACDGCAACFYACPNGAVRMVPQQEGYWYHSITPYGSLFHAELHPGRENSGKLVTLIKQKALSWAEYAHFRYVIIDGSPGIGCPVISACSGADLGLIVTEPSLAGLHDLKRIRGTLRHFRIPTLLCINKADLYPIGAENIRNYSRDEEIVLVGEIPFDENVPKAILAGAPITDLFPDSPAAQSMRMIWQETFNQLFERK